MRIFFFVALACAACSNSPDASDAGPDAAFEAGRAIVVDHVDDLGGFSAPPTVVGRDGTSSALVGDRIVWTFGDTFLTKNNPDDNTPVRSATAGWSTAANPVALTEPVDGAGLPHQLVPYTAAELQKNQTDPTNGFALWPGPAVATSATSAVVFFQHVVRSSGGFTSDAIGTCTLAKDATEAVRDPSFLFTSPEPLFGNGGATVDSGNVHLFACDQVVGFDFACKVARAPIASANVRSAYTFWDGKTWTSDLTKTAPFIDGAAPGISVEYSAFLGRWIAVYSKPLSNDVALRAGDALTGPWDSEVVVPGSTPGLVTSDAGANYLAKENIALADAALPNALYVGYAHPLPNFGGDPHLARITLK